MVPVASLLNPMPSSSERSRDSSSPTLKDPKQSSPSVALSKKQKMSKAAATFVKGKPKGKVNYPPYEIQDEATATEHAKFEVQPIGRIGEYPKRIPYNSEKKTFQQKTGMDGFEVYQYTFRMPDDPREKDAHAVMWDYNVGLVRITAFFKSLKHTKTMPAKVMNANPGLREISHSITGGSISAQGYWVPFEAAKAVAATFCYDIRYVLVPVFGPDFVSMCQEGCEEPRLKICPSIVQRCTEAATASQSHSRESSVAVSPRTLTSWPPKSVGPRSAKTLDAESGYGTDSERSERYSGSPGSPGSIEWTPVNTPRLTQLETYRFLQQPPRNVTSTPRGFGLSSSSHTRQRRTNTKRVISESEEASEAEGSSGHSSIGTPTSAKRRKISPPMTPEIGAAFTLMELNVADTTTGETTPSKRRRASA